MTYRELFQLEGLEKIKLHAGRDITSREILGAHVIELADAGSWVSAGELIFVSGIAFADVQGDLRRLLDSLSKKNVAGVVVEIGVYITSISDEIIEYAAKLNVPLLSLPFEIPVSSIISQIYRVIYRQEEEQKSVGQFMRELVYGNIGDAMKIGDRFGLDIRGTYVPVFFRMVDEKDAVPGREVIELLEHGVRHAFEGRGAVLTMADPEGVLLLDNAAADNAAGNAAIYFGNGIREIEKHLKVKGCDYRVFAGVGSCTDLCDAAGICESLDECRKVSVIAAAGGSDRVMFFSKMGISKVFMKLGSTKVLNELYLECLGPLIDYEHGTHGELMETLRMYTACDYSISDTTERLFVHRNTVKYRLKRITDILGEDITRGDIRFKIMLAFEALDYLSMMDKK